MPPTVDDRAVTEFTELEGRLALCRAARSGQSSASAAQTDDRSTPEAIPPGRLRLASANVRHLSAIVQELVQLRHLADCDEYGALRATQHAFDAACGLLTDAAIASALNGREIPWLFRRICG